MNRVPAAMAFTGRSPSGVIIVMLWLRVWCHAVRRDALKRARLHRAGELTPVWVPGPEQEAMRDLTRASEDMIALQTKARQRLGAFLVRYARVDPGKSRWTQAHKAWLSDQSFDHPVQQLVFQEYVDACYEAARRVADLDDQIRKAAAS